MKRQIGIADYQELAKGQMLGGADGFLKLIFHSETLRLLGVHCIGDGATEIIHIGQASATGRGARGRVFTLFDRCRAPRPEP